MTDTFDLSTSLDKVLSIAEIVIACIFALEFLVRVWLAPFAYPTLRPDKARMHYIFSFMAIIDLLSIVPVFFINLPNTTGILKIFKLCKILRLVKASRYLSGIAAFGEAIKAKKKQITFSIIALMILIVLCSLLMYSFEHEAQPDVYKNGFSGIMYGFASITSFGESSAEPVTTIGSVLSTLMLLLGGCIFGVPVAIIADGFGEMIAKQASDDEDDEKAEVDNKDENPRLDMLKEIYELLTDEEKEEFKKII